MNFLAHIYLSGEDEEIRVGNFIGDFVKGNQLDSYSEKMRKGIELHRFIDHYTDHHDVVRKSKKRLWDDYGHYSSVIVDIYYDHFLAKDFARISRRDLGPYTLEFYQMIRDYSTLVPERVNDMLFYMKKDNWLYNYQFVEGIGRALSGLSRRTRFDSGMERATTNLRAHYESFQEEFDTFFPELQKQAADFLKQ